jgi:hypothetical protein
LIICFLVPIVLLLFGILTILQAIAGILLLSGLWAVAYGIIFARLRDRLYNVGAGIIVIAISTFVFLPIEYVLGLVLISVIAIVLTSITMTRNSKIR